jgi:hypothetical protein
MPSAWIEHVKKYASENGVSYRQAMKDSKATYVSVAKPKKKYVPKPGAKPRGRPKKEREQMGMEDFDAPQTLKKIRIRKLKMKKYADLAGDAEAEFDENDPVNFMSVKEQGDTGLQLFEAAKSRMKAKDLRKLEKKQKPIIKLKLKSPKRKVKVIKYDENDPVNFMSVKEQRELEPIPEAPFKQPPTLVLPKPYIEKIPTPKKFLYKNPLLERDIIKSIKTTRGKQMKRRSMRQLEVDKFKDVIKSLEDPILEKQKRRAVALSEAYTMGEEDRLSAQEREYVRAKKLPVPVSALELIEVKKQKRLKRYQKESEKILEKARKEKELAKIVASYGVPKTRQQIIEDRANDWSSEF